MKTIEIEKGTLDSCVQEAQGERVVVTRNGVPVAVVMGLEGLDQEQLELSSSVEFWSLISRRRDQPTILRSELERRLGDTH